MPFICYICWVFLSNNGIQQLPPGLRAQDIPVTFTTENGWIYDGRIELPAQNGRNGYAVMLLGGGMGSPIDWEVPGVMAIDGKPTRDADTIAKALIDAGFIVMRWQAIRRDDPKRAEDPLMMDAPPFPQTIEQTKKAYAAFREKNMVADDRILLLGHSLGARRAAVLIEENPKTPGVVMLAGATLLPSNLEAARKVVSEAENSWKGEKRNAAAAELAREEKSGPHEWAVRLLDRKREDWFKPSAGTKDKHGFGWAADVIAERKTPTLLIVGTLDERWLVESYMFTSCLRRGRHPNYTWKVYEGLGHQLGPEVAGPVEYKDQGVIVDSRTGPIDEEVVTEMVDWLLERTK